MEELKIKAPAKINIGLNVVSKRPDGYHNIETIFYPLRLYDYLTITKANNFLFTSNNSALISTNDNLIIEAKEKLEKEIGQKINVHIHLEKNIPIGGGLGGGSSDAASTLTGLNKFLELNLGYEKLLNLALYIGSDVPFFLNPKPCFAESRGEKLSSLDFTISYPILIVNPNIHISTQWAYNNISPQTPRFNLKDFTQEHINAPDKLSQFLKNDFEEIVFEKYPEIKKLKEGLRERGADFALMSGSGSTVFGIFRELPIAKKAERILRENYFTYIEN
jgi:4-diphosphocytidyl-2-C-methyl-D-erythritol kinase